MKHALLSACILVAIAAPALAQSSGGTMTYFGSAGKSRSTRIRKGAPWLKPVLVQAAWGATRKKNSYFQAQFLRLKARHGAKKQRSPLPRRS